jgi:Ni/Fe-hydrogenase 1 B-type cytochrome subunit
VSAPELERRYVWDRVIRAVHWTLFASIAALAFTGFYIADPFLAASGEARGRFVMGWMRQVHFLGAIAFSLAVATRLIWLFAGPPQARWRELIPTSRARLRELAAVARYYLWPRGEPPVHEGHNPLAGLSYLAFYALAIAMTVTGFALYAVSAPLGSPIRLLFGWLLPLLGGAQLARWLHHALMWAVLLFAMIHVYLALFNAFVGRAGLLDSIVTGWKVVRRGGRRG